ncbi:MAG: HAD-IIIA family hydrolase [Planctomycetaceae bacterium]|nr:HAD-IIIA family hydrolase [Planctomycetaceae bacterium]
MVRWIVFDAVGTLLAPSPSVAEAYHQIGASLGSRLDVAEVGRRFRELFPRSETECFPSERHGRTSEPEERKRWRWIVERVLDDVTDREACFQRLWDHFTTPSSWMLFDDVPDAIEQLTQQGYRLAIASNFDARLHALCEACPALRSVTLRLVSSEVGYRKPAAEFYDAVIAACGVAPELILMIGDDWDADIVAARRAGLQAAWLNRRATGGDDGNAIASLRELIPR